MEVGSPRSPTAQFAVSHFCDPVNASGYVCPSAPRKPAYRQEQASGNFDSAVRCARDMLDSFSDEERQTALRHLPRHTLEGVFLSFCHYQAGSQLGLEFAELLAVAPTLEQQLLDHVQAVCPNITWEAWAAEVQMAVADPCRAQQLAERIMSEVFPSRRLLF